MDSTKLLSILNTHFNLEGLRTLCFTLRVDYDNLAGETKEGKARELILYMEQNGRLSALIQQIQQERPNLPLEETVIIDDEERPIPPLPLPDPLLTDIHEKLHQQRLVLFIGADLPASTTGIPGRQALADQLARQENLLPGPPLPLIAQQIMQSGNRFRFTEFLRSQLDTTGKSPQPLHQHIVTLVQTYHLKTLITTAYDDLLEIAFRQRQVGLNRVIIDADLRFINPANLTLIKLYGDWQRVDSLTVTQQDVNALFKGREKAEIVQEVQYLFRRHTLLFIGHDLQDPFVGNLFDEVAGDKFQIPAYAIWPNATQQEAASFKSNRGLTILAVDPLTFLTQLAMVNSG